LVLCRRWVLAFALRRRFRRCLGFLIVMHSPGFQLSQGFPISFLLVLPLIRRRGTMPVMPGITLAVATDPTTQEPKVALLAGQVRLVVDLDGATSLGVQLIELAALLRGVPDAEEIGTKPGESGLIVPADAGALLPPPPGRRG